MSKERQIGWILKSKVMPTLYFSGFGSNKQVFPRYTQYISDSMIITSKVELEKLLTKELKKEVNVLELWVKEVSKVVSVVSEKPTKVVKLEKKKPSPKVAAKPALSSKAKTVAKKQKPTKVAATKKPAKKTTAGRKTK